MALHVYRVWRSQESRPAAQRTRGAVLRHALTELGPVFVKCGQTMSERPDVVRRASSLQSPPLKPGRSQAWLWEALKNSAAFVDGGRAR